MVKICQVRYTLVSNAGPVVVGVMFKAIVRIFGIGERGIPYRMPPPLGGGVREKAIGSLSLVPEPTPQ